MAHVKRVARFSTGTVDIHPQHAYRGLSPMYWWILTSRRWLTGRPINVYVIEHTDGVVVFDTGQDRDSVTDPCYFPDGPTGVIYRRLAKFHVNDDETFTAGLKRLGYVPADVTTAVISHLHQDHIGGVGEIPHADLLISADEWRSLHRPMAEPRGLLRTHIELPTSTGPPSTSVRSTTQRYGPSQSATTCSVTGRSSSFQRPGTRTAPCRCSSTGMRDRHYCLPAT